MPVNLPIPPRNIEEYVEVLRASVMDFPELNHVLLDRDDDSNQDFTDQELALAVYRGLGDVNIFPPATKFVVDQFPHDTHWSMLVDLGIIRLLESKSILKIRNEMPYQDNGGVSVDMRGKWQAYQSALQPIIHRAHQQLSIFKHTMSVRAGYGDVRSPYSTFYGGW